MAPIPTLRTPSGEQIRRISRSVFSPESRSSEDNTTPLSSIFAVLSQETSFITSRALQVVSHIKDVFTRQNAPVSSPSISKRQGILAIPTTYAGINDGPAPGAVVGIVLGAVVGFLLALWLVYSILNLSGRFGSRTIIEEEVIRRRSRSPRRSRSRSETEEVRSEHHSPPPPRRTSRRETIVVEERISRPPPEDDIVEVIEEHSPDRRPNRRESKRSGFRTVDPAAFGGGDAPMRKVSRR